jgi:hypothetical protein
VKGLVHGSVGRVQRSGLAVFWVRAAAAVLLRPHLWSTAARQGFRLARPGWWRHPPFLPLPDSEYLQFRLETQYGSDGRPDPRDLVTYLEWCREIGALKGFH